LEGALQVSEADVAKLKEELKVGLWFSSSFCISILHLYFLGCFGRVRSFQSKGNSAPKDRVGGMDIFYSLTWVLNLSSTMIRVNRK
jgi:hypothetical protein